MWITQHYEREEEKCKIQHIDQHDHLWGFLLNHIAKSGFTSSGGCANPWCIWQAVICQTCSSGANWQARCDFILASIPCFFLQTGNISAKEPACNNYWDVVIHGWWLIRAVNLHHLDIHDNWWQLTWSFFFKVSLLFYCAAQIVSLTHLKHHFHCHVLVEMTLLHRTQSVTELLAFTNV